jgi:hypothetical protein
MNRREHHRALLRYPRAAALCILLASAALALAGQESVMNESAPVVAETLAATTATVSVRDAIVTVELVAAQAAARLRERLAALPPGREAYLVIDGLRVIADPGTLYRVELVAVQAGRASEPSVRTAGSFNVFGVAHERGATSLRSFVVTAPLRELLARGGVAVRIVPDAQAAAGADVEIGRISLLLQ